VPHDLRDQVVDFLERLTLLTGLPAVRLLGWLELSRRKFHRWRGRYGKANEHNAPVPRDHWLEEWERAAIIKFAGQYPLEGHRRLTFMMLDRDIVAVSPATTYRVLKEAGLIGDRWQPSSRKGLGFVQPLQPHDHWHVDFTYVKLSGVFYYLCVVLDGCSRYIVAWDLRTEMTEADAEIVIQRGRERFPDARPRIISDRGPAFVAKDFKIFIDLWQASHVLTSPHYPQSNGKLERFNRTLRCEAIRPQTPLDQDDGKRVVRRFIEHYCDVRLHSAIGYITPADRLAGRHTAIFAARDKKLEAARQQRKLNRQSSTARVA